MPVLELVAEACGKLPAPAPWLTWIAGDDFELVSRRFAGFPNIKVQRSEQLIDRLMVAADVVITKGTRKTSLESAALGIPSISLSAGLNPIDEARIRRISSNLALDVRATSAIDLANAIERVCEPARMAMTERTPAAYDGLNAVATRIADHIYAI